MLFLKSPCLERLSWSWRPINDNPLLSDQIFANTVLKEKILSELKLQEHESGNYPTSVCLFGPSGSGKTSFLRSFALGVEGYRDIIVVSFEKQEFLATNPSIVDILKSISHQILRHAPSVFSRISQYYESLKGLAVWSENLLWSLISKLLHDSRGYRIVLLIDDINDWKLSFTKLLGDLKNLIQSSPSELRIIYTATVDIPGILTGPPLSMNMAEEATHKEVTQILKKENRSQLVNESVKEAVDCELQGISESCLTTYLYLKKVSRLTKVTTLSTLRKVLPKIPHRRDDIYQAEMELLAEKDHDILQWCWSSLSWLVQTIHPLTIQELSVAVALHQIGSGLSREEVRNHISVNMWDDLHRHLGLFVKRDKLRPAIVHDTAKHFIRSYRNTNTKGGFGLASHADIVILCLRYLKSFMATYDNSTAEEHPEYEFIAYSAEYWPRHYQLALEDDQVNQTNIDQQVFEFLSCRDTRMPWFKKYQTTASRSISANPAEIGALEVACGLGQVRVVSLMLGEKTSHGLDNVLLGRSLNTAITNSQSAVVPILLHAGARSELALSLAVERNMISVVDQMLEHEPNFEETSSFEKAIIAAAIHGRLEAMIKLCDYCTDLDKLDQIKSSAFEMAVIYGHASIVSFLLLHARRRTESLDDFASLTNVSGSERANLFSKPLFDKCKSALETAAAQGHTETISILLRAGVEATELALENATKQQNLYTVGLLAEAFKSQGCILRCSRALRLASEGGCLAVVKKLLEYGVDTDCRDSSVNQTPLHKASKQGHEDVVQLLLQKGADRNACDDHGAMPCHLAARGGHIQAYIALQEDPETRQDDLSVTYAAKGGHLLMVKYLLSLKLKTAQTRDQTILDSPLLEAASRGYVFVVHELCEAGFDLNTRTGTSSPLHCAASGGYVDIVSYLITKGAEVNSRNEARRSPLHLSVAYSKVVELLLEKGADPNVVDLNERTPLHIATLGRHLSVIMALIDHRADAMIEDEWGNTALDLARTIENGGEVIELLEGVTEKDI
ncbi:ankyrin repeat-containing domain protein [Nemania diffusa]|nr:ankyrin repeat-containing domain protein [Nemania diffusa]